MINEADTFAEGRGTTAAALLAVALVGSLLSGCSDAPGVGTADGVPPDTEAAAGGVPDDERVEVATGLGFLRDRQVYLPQFAGNSDENLYLVWIERGEGRRADLFLSRRGPDEVFTPPVRVNDVPGSVSGGSLDEGRPAVAAGRNGTVAVAWSAGGDIRAALSHDAGDSFAPSVNLNSDEGVRAYRGFAGMDLDDDGVAHAAWIDARTAPRGAEEPADLYYARIEDGVVSEHNLTETQVDSICGCCRIDVQVRDTEVVIAFRNTGGGYRDVHRVVGNTAGEFGAPFRLGPPMWELNGCPVIGPLNVGDATLWAEASTGKRRLLVATGGGGEFETVLEDTEQWRIDRPPRLLGRRGDEFLLLVPGRPGGRLLQGSGSAWRGAGAEIPQWAMSGAIAGTDLLLIGSVDGQLQAERRSIDF